jgi:hypothetical protein
LNAGSSFWAVYGFGDVGFWGLLGLTCNFAEVFGLFLALASPAEEQWQ